MARVITEVNRLTPEHLTDILRREGMLDRGYVTDIAVRANPAFNSTVSHLDLSYSTDASPHALPHLLLKRNVQEDWGRESGRSEVAFYTMVSPLRDSLPMIVPCFDAEYDAETHDSHVLLLDLSGTHAPPVTRDQQIAMSNVPTEEQLEAIVDVVGALHAYWWEHSSLGSGTLEISNWYANREAFDKSVREWRECWMSFIADEGHDFPDDLRALYEYAAERIPVLWERYLVGRVTQRRNLTLVHGDCYLCQFLCPLDGAGQTYLIDFQGAFTDFPTLDLTHLFATFWTPEQRHEENREERMLLRYLDVLHAHGITGYSWEQLQTDYRLLLIFMVFYPIWDQTNGSSKGYWWPKVRSLTSTYRDWECEKLLL